MNKFKLFIKNSLSFTNVLLLHFPVSYIALCLTTILGAVYLGMETAELRSVDLQVSLQIFLTALLFTVGCFFVENIPVNIKWKIKIPIVVVYGIISIFWVGIMLKKPAYLTGVSAVFRQYFTEKRISMFSLGLIGIMLIMSLYFQFVRHGELTFGTFLIRIFNKCFMSALIYGVLNIGMVFLVLIFTTLLWGDFSVIYFPIWACITGLFYVPNILHAIAEPEQENRFIQVLVRYVMLSMCIAAYVIIYTYMAKILILRDIPSNSIFAILTALFVVSTAICFMCGAYENRGFLQKFAYYQPFIFAPFLVLQGYAVFARIGQYGITVSRYFGVAYLVFELAFIILYLLSLLVHKNALIKQAFPILAVILLVSCVIPGVNAYSVSEKWGTKATGATVYEPQDFENIIYHSVGLDLDIQGYRRIREVSIDCEGEVDLTALPIRYSETGAELMEVDLTSFSSDVINRFWSDGNTAGADNEIPIGSSKLVITYANLIVESEKSDVTNVSISGYLLDQ